MNRAFLDARTGTKWDLFFAGVSAYSPDENDAIPMRNEGGVRLYFNPGAFSQIEHSVYDGLGTVDRGDYWRYSETTDLVSFMCYTRQPDWTSLSAARIAEDGPTLGEISRGLVNWQDDDVDPALAPGQSPLNGASNVAPSLLAGLAWTGKSAGAAVVGAFAVDLVRQLLS